MKKRIVIETNWWVSFILSKYSVGLPSFFLDNSFDFYFSPELLKEINITLNYPRLLKRINKKNFKIYYDFVEDFAVIVNVSSVLLICRDPKDNFLLALAKDAKTDFLITRDEDLLTLQQFESTRIVTLNQFLEIINSSMP